MGLNISTELMTATLLYIQMSKLLEKIYPKVVRHKMCKKEGMILIVGKCGGPVGYEPQKRQRAKQGLALYIWAAFCLESVSEIQGDDVGVHILEFTL